MTQEEAEDIKRHFNVVAEGLRPEIRLVADGHAALDRRIDQLRQEVHEYRVEARSGPRLVTGSLRSDMVHLRTNIAEIRTDMADSRLGMADFRAGMVDFRMGMADLRQEMASFRQEVQGEFRDVRALISLSSTRLEKVERKHS